MKKAFLIAALVTAAIPAMASKARLNSMSAGAYDSDGPMNGPAHVIDTQTVFDNPAHALRLGEYVTFEMGPSSTNVVSLATNKVTPGAEGGFAKRTGEDAMYSFYLGRKSKFTSKVRALGAFAGQENPIEIQYAKKGEGMDWGVAFNYSSSDDKTNSRKQNAMGARFGMFTGAYEAFISLGLGSEATGNAAGSALGWASSADAKYKGTMGYKLGVKRKIEESGTVYFENYNDGMKYENSADTNFDGMKVETFNLRLGYIQETKVDVGTFFYGAEYQTNKDERKGATLAAGNSKTESSRLPLFAGLELETAPWMVLRGSIRQNVLLGSTKTDGATPGESDTVANDTQVAAGVGLKFNKLVVDTSLSAQNTGSISPSAAGAFMTNASMTYTF